MTKKPKKFNSFFGGEREVGKAGFKSMLDNNYIDDTLEKESAELRKVNEALKKQIELNKDKK